MRFPNARVQPIITNALQTMTITQLTEQTGVGHHSIAAIRDGKQEWVSEHVMDRLMCGLDLPELMHTDFADIYEAAA